MEADSLSSAPPHPPAAAIAPPAQPGRWSSVLQKDPTPKPQEAISNRVFGPCTSSNGIAVAVVDANALIHGDKLSGCADKFVSVREVLEEVRDPVSRHRLSFLPFPVETIEPSPEFIKKVVKFARETGDLQTLSDVDLKLIALTYMLEAQIHGTGNLRDKPPPLHVMNVKNLGEGEMPGWGSNVPNLAEWEALEQATETDHHNTRILAIKDLNPQAEPDGACLNQQDDDSPAFSIPKRSFPPKKEIILEGKKMVAAGIDASQGEDAENLDDWRPAVSRSTHRRYLRRKARRELSEASEENGQLSCYGEVADGISGGNNVLSDGEVDCPEFHQCASSDQHLENEFTVNEERTDVKVKDATLDFDTSHEHPLIEEDDTIDEFSEALDNLELNSEPDGSIDASYIDEESREQSWTLKSLSESSVACVTGDYAMQNVLLQIGLRLLAPGGMQIRQLHRWILKCHACNKVTQEIGRIFCPKCGNGGTLRKVSVTVGENGIIMAARRQRIFLRGTKFSLPLPQGGREAITKNPILREDQLPHKLLYPKSKKKSSNKDNDFLSTDDIFSHCGEKRVPLKPPVKKALSMFSGRRNPNDNHFSRRKH
ncbi:RNA-binding protein NOB1 [Canna indica]|uniref:RNA-binding protein NOB1 n=1 Tax=Canna indica TaxID=4628 RepID=A0AAQ3JML3_9LILI|nr:RNA-binding protein NOB1 [Canna indica]